MAHILVNIFLDANILFSASLPDGLLADFIGNLQQHAELLTSDYAKEEAERNIASKFPDRLTHFRRVAGRINCAPDTLFGLDVRLPEKDRPILCSAISASADFLLTGDKRDFGHLFGKRVAGVRVVSVQMLLSELIARGVVTDQ